MGEYGGSGGDTAQLHSAERPTEIPPKGTPKRAQSAPHGNVKCQTDAKNKESTIKSLCQESPRDTNSQLLLYFSTTQPKDVVFSNTRAGFPKLSPGPPAPLGAHFVFCPSTTQLTRTTNSSSSFDYLNQPSLGNTALECTLMRGRRCDTKRTLWWSHNRARVLQPSLTPNDVC